MVTTSCAASAVIGIGVRVTTLDGRVHEGTLRRDGDVIVLEVDRRVVRHLRTDAAWREQVRAFHVPGRSVEVRARHRDLESIRAGGPWRQRAASS